MSARVVMGAALALLSSAAVAAEPVSAGANDQMATMVASLVGVVGLIIVLAVLARRFNLPNSVGGPMKTVAMLPVGTKERVAVIQVGEQQYLVGITGQSVTLLDKLEQPLETAAAPQFASVLAKFNKKRES
ncbi:flagellar biosynthetic protein FliO [Ferrimonas balearica]|uniref:flagellar biosynthetic protein FliO n=1 Tax=Ferrimonas balearica TaxID=44012 RepID=UPI001C95CBF6|nr:flagellar biosynthetic protein FliO [Ferrimonas balearica]MBY6105225.1 flagellar biosynthetic protein FliO [Ferrimonas balearica]